MDSTKPLQDKPFGFTEMGDGRVNINYYGKLVTTLSGKQAAQFVFKADSLDEHGKQVLMAKATGQFKRGNERASKLRK